MLACRAAQEEEKKVMAEKKLFIHAYIDMRGKDCVCERMRCMLADMYIYKYLINNLCVYICLYECTALISFMC